MTMAMAGVLPCSTLSLHPCRRAAVTRAAVSTTKHGHRLLSSLQAVSGDSAAADRLVRKFVSSSSKSAALQTLSLLISQSSPSAISMYRRVTETPWFRWNPTFAAAIAALLEKDGRFLESEVLMSESTSNLAPRDMAVFHCSLIESFAKHGLRSRVFDSYSLLTNAGLVNRRVFESMVKALCSMESPVEAEQMTAEMGSRGFHPSGFEFRLVAQCYGRSGRFEDMIRVVGDMESAGLPLDTISANLVLSCYGESNQLPQMVEWIRQMRGSSIPFSTRTYNAVLNSCPSLISVTRDLDSLPISVARVLERLRDSPEESALLRELSAGREVLAEVAEWEPEEWKVDLHGCHLGSALVILLLWLEEVRARCEEGKEAAAEVVVVCGSGRHSSVRGESPVRAMVSKAMLLMESPLKMERRKPGRFVAKGKALKEWVLLRYTEN